ncbi:hypothetical protein MILUP08_41234 [Micromonospora lupini str. Lupac 08]|uniref:Uncharacterized protein n=1 Tax=Micromonospora lupini str. Lupac 08 TaxID=1150864 RepID=I0KXM3_9ACTN|nr:hypothetical protein MILUP08_41234 [Micromonospora lupini str. Lupac 08]
MEPVALTQADQRQVQGLLTQLEGAVVREARLSPLGGSWISVELGRSLLFVNMAAWRLESDTDFLAACEDDREQMGRMITELDGRRLESVEVSRHLDLTLTFEGLRLLLFACTGPDGDDEHWSLQLATGETLFAGPGDSWTLAQSQ